MAGESKYQLYPLSEGAAGAHVTLCTIYYQIRSYRPKTIWPGGKATWPDDFLVMFESLFFTWRVHLHNREIQIQQISMKCLRLYFVQSQPCSLAWRLWYWWYSEYTVSVSSIQYLYNVQLVATDEAQYRHKDNNTVIKSERDETNISWQYQK